MNSISILRAGALAAALASRPDRMAPRQENAEAVARAVCAFGAAGDIGVAVLGSSGADEGVFGTAAGETWVAVAGPQGVAAERIGYGGGDEMTCQRIGNQALLMILRALQE